MKEFEEEEAWERKQFEEEVLQDGDGDGPLPGVPVQQKVLPLNAYRNVAPSRRQAERAAAIEQRKAASMAHMDSKTGKGLEKMYALATLTNLAHDTAALRIQMAFRGFAARKATNKRRGKGSSLLKNKMKSKLSRK